MPITSKSPINVIMLKVKPAIYMKKNVATTEVGSASALISVERLHFTDENIALDISGIAGQAYRLSQAAFDRKPDLKGLGYWINDKDLGSSRTTVAAGFILSAGCHERLCTNTTIACGHTKFYPQ